MADLKDELNEIVVALGQIRPDAIIADEPLLADNWNKIVNSIEKLTLAVSKINSVSPSLPLIGYKYFRFPGEKLPWQLYPATTESDWSALHTRYSGVVLRLSGGNASSFKEDSIHINYDETVKGSGGGQMDAVQKHNHRYTYSEKGSEGLAWGVHNIADILHLSALSDSNTGRSDIETRMKNMTVEVYEYRADLNLNQ